MGLSLIIILADDEAGFRTAWQDAGNKQMHVSVHKKIGSGKVYELVHTDYYPRKRKSLEADARIWLESVLDAAEQTQ